MATPKIPQLHSLTLPGLTGKDPIDVAFDKHLAAKNLGLLDNALPAERADMMQSIHKRALFPAMETMLHYTAETISHYGHAALKPTGLATSLQSKDQNQGVTV